MASGLARFRRRSVKAVVAEVLLGSRQQLSVHALRLKAQHDQYIDVLDAFVHVEEGLHPEFFDLGREQGRRADHAKVGHAELAQGMNLGTCHPRVQEVAGDGNAQGSKCPFFLTNGEHVQHRLCRVRVTTISQH
jgi:hypothetical protein